MNERARRRFWFWGLLAAGFLLRAGYAVHAYRSNFKSPYSANPLDPDSYDLMARHLLDLGELSVAAGQPLTDREPLFPLLLAGVHAVLGPSLAAGLALNLVFGVLCCWLTYLLAESLFGDDRAALASLALACFFPEWIYYGAFLYREIFVTLLLILWAWLWAGHGRKAEPRPYAAMGLVFGALCLTRSAMAPLGPAFLLLAAPRLKPRAWGRTLAPFVACAALLQAPWIARNYALTGRFVAGSTMGGSVMYLSLLKDYDRPEVALEHPLEEGADPVIRDVARRGLSTAQAEPVFYRACWDMLVDRPGYFWSQFLRKAAKLWRPYPNEGWQYRYSYSLLRVVGLISNGGLMLLGLWGAVAARRAGRPIGFLLLVPLVMTFVYGLYWSVTRYHSPLLFAAMPLGGFALARASARRGGLLAALLFLMMPGRAFAGALDLALDAELKRATTSLKEEGYPPPYYVSLTATDIASWERRCLMGDASFEARYSQRLLTPDVRVGSYALDNHPVSPGGAFAGASVGIGEDEFSLRYSLWRLLDGAYKGAAAGFLRKQALRVSRGKTEYDTDDLSREAPRARRAAQPADPFPEAGLGELCLRASAVFRESPGLLHAEVTVGKRRQWSSLRDSEGSAVDFGRDYVELGLEAVDLSPDGTRLFASRHFAAAAPGALPSAEKLEAEARGMLEDLRALKVAGTTSPFSAPALLDPSVAAAVVLAIGTRLTGEEQRNPGGAQTFRDRMGKKVLPSELTLEDDPTLAEFGGLPLAGHYDFDDQGVAARKATVVEGGVLKGLLLSRYPVIGFPHSNGHARSFPGFPPQGAPGTLILRSDRGLSADALLARLREECRRRGKPYGLWVKKLRAFTQNQGSGGHASVRLLPELLYLVEASTGRQILVRDLDMVGTPLVLMNNILAAGRDAQAKNEMLGVPVSVVVPSLLLSDVEIQRAETKPEKAPVLPPPEPR